MEPLATVEYYEARYGPVDDRDRVSALLDDATAFILSQGVRQDPDDEVLTANLARVCCAVVHRSLLAGRYAGLSSVSQGAGGQSASVSVYNPGGDLYLTASEKRALGIGGGSFGAILPDIGRCAP